MIYQELHQRYGNHIAKRIQVELSVSEFKQVMVEELSKYLEMRAEAAHKEYQILLDNPFINDKVRIKHEANAKALYNQWRNAEDLAYLIAVADDFCAQMRFDALPA